MPTLFNKFTVYVPAKFLPTPDFAEARDAIIRAAGGVTIGKDNHGYWVNPSTGEVVSEEVATITVLCTHEDSDEVSDAIAVLVSYLKDNGEQAVLVEATSTDGDTSWCAALY